MSGPTLPTTIESARIVICDWVKTVLPSRAVILQNFGEMAKPNSPFVSVFINASEVPNGRVLTLSDDGLTQTVSTLLKLNVTFDILGGEAFDDMARLRNSIYSTDRFRDVFLTLGYGGAEALTDLTFLETGHLKPRVQMIMTFYARVNSDFASDYYASLPVTLEREA